MTTFAALLLVALDAGPGDPERLLLCRPQVEGEPGLARADALPTAGRAHGARFIDYGVACEGPAEAARAARRAGLSLAVSSVAEGRTEGSRFHLTLSATDERTLARRTVEVAPGADAVPPLRRSLGELLEAVPDRHETRPGPWIAAGAGVALVAAGAGFALAARSSAEARDRAGARGDWRGYVSKDASWRRWRTASGVAWGAGAAALAVGLAWRFHF
jgi:hypothetical protein